LWLLSLSNDVTLEKKYHTVDLIEDRGSFPVGTPANGVPKVILTVGTMFPERY